MSCWIFWNIFVTNLPLCEKKEQSPDKVLKMSNKANKKTKANLWKPLGKQAVAVDLNKLAIRIPAVRQG